MTAHSSRCSSVTASTGSMANRPRSSAYAPRSRAAAARSRASASASSGEVTRAHQLVVEAQRVGGGPVEGDRARVEDDDALARALDERRVVGDEHERRAALDLLGDPRLALALEGLVADGQHLVDEQHVGVEVRGDREAEPHEHAARVRLDRDVDEVAELGEGDDVVDARRDLVSRQPVEGPAEKDVLASGEVAAEARAELEQRDDLAATPRARAATARS